MPALRFVVSMALAVILLALTMPLAAQEKVPEKTQEKQVPKAPEGFAIRRDGIERGQIETIEYDSKTLNTKRKLVVYTPPGYDKETQYPVFYLLHGKGGNESDWTKWGSAGDILDNLYADKKLTPMIVVMPNGEIPNGDGSEFTVFESELFKDVMPLIEARYATLTDPEHRALAGLSRGGGQALRIGVRHLDTFAYIGGFSSANGRPRIPGDKGDAVKKIRLLWISCGEEDSLLKANKGYHDLLEKQEIPHIWHVEAGGHTFTVWMNDLYLFSQKLFRDKEKEKAKDK